VVTPLLDVLERSRSLGFLGPGSVRVHVDHADGFAAGLEQPPPSRFLDLGSGGGVPGLVLSLRWVDSEAVLLDARVRRCGFLEEAVQSLGLADRVTVVCARAEEAGRRVDLRARFDLVVARGFGRPATTAECGAPFLRVGGTLAVSEPPLDDGAIASGGGLSTRWDPAGLARVGLALGRSWVQQYGYQALQQVEPCPPQYPRRTGIPAKRPLF
jgi:16S rRNA (guanine527-N7)-methyltransferase